MQPYHTNTTQLHHTNLLESESRNVGIFHRDVLMFLSPLCRWETKSQRSALPCPAQMILQDEGKELA